MANVNLNIKKEPEAMETETEEVEETYQCNHCGDEYDNEYDADDCCYCCEQCGESWSYEEDAEQCCMASCPNCGEKYDDYDDAQNCCEENGYGTMGKSETAPWVDRGHNFASTENKDDMDQAIDYWGIKHRPAPNKSAADFYLLEIITNDLYKATGERAKYITPEVIFNMKHMFGMDVIDLYRHAADMDLNAFENLMFTASVEAVRQIELLDSVFLAYCQMAIGGELRHHRAVGGKVIDPPSRRAASWIAWKDAVEAVGPEIFNDAALLFREFSGGSYGGNKWAVPCEIVNMRMTDQLGPTPFMNRKLFVDRVWTLEHNGGCFLNKIGWPDGLYLQPILDAHASHPEDIMFLYTKASDGVKELFASYMNMAEELNPDGVRPDFDLESLSAEHTFCRYCFGNVDYGHHFGCEVIRAGHTQTATKTVCGAELNTGKYAPADVKKILHKAPYYDNDGNIINPVKLQTRIKVRVYADPDNSFTYSWFGSILVHSMSDQLEDKLHDISLDDFPQNFEDFQRIEMEVMMESRGIHGYDSVFSTLFPVEHNMTADTIKTYGDIFSLTGKKLQTA